MGDEDDDDADDVGEDATIGLKEGISDQQKKDVGNKLTGAYDSKNIKKPSEMGDTSYSLSHSSARVSRADDR